MLKEKSSCDFGS
jgi:hypothetical protein